MSDTSQDSDGMFLSMLQQSATQRIIEFLTDPKMDQVRTRLRQGWYGPVLGPSCRRAVLGQLDILGEPGLKLGLLIYSLEVLMGLVCWDQVAEAVKLDQPERSPYLTRALEGN